MKNLPRTDILFVTLPFLFLAGCSSYDLISVAPDHLQPVIINFTEDQLLGWKEVPASAYFVPDSQVVIIGQPGQAGNVPDTGRPAWLSVIGVAGTLMGGSGTGEQLGRAGKIDLEGMEDAMRINLTSQAINATRQLISAGHFAGYFAISEHPTHSVLTVFTTIILTYVNETDAVPSILLKATLTDSSAAKKVWESRYFASLQEPLPVAGDGSWAELGAAGIKKALAPDLERVIEFMLSDIARPRVRDDENLYMVQGRFPYLKERIQTVGYKLDEDDQSLYFAPKMDDSMVFSGIHILKKSETRYRKAASGDVGISGFKILRESEQ